MNPTFKSLSVAFVALTLVFWGIEYFWPSVPKQKRLRRGFATDVIYWMFTPLVTKSISRVLMLIVLVPLLLMLGRSLDRQAVAAGYGPMVALPTWLQAVLVFVVGDFIGYWSHRWFHGRRLWKFHAVHHSSKELDWLSSVRLHPVNDAVSRILQAVPFVLLGFSPLVVAAYVPFLTFYAILLHANVSWSFGPLGYVLASPAFHRWHHTKETEAIDKNFAGLLPVWDLMFGTFYLPHDRQPIEFGVHDDGVPETFWGQLAYPFRRAT